jgi:hypothetical protein
MKKTDFADQLFDAVLTLKSRDELYMFFGDICTPKEIETFAQRFVVAKLLNEKKIPLELRSRIPIIYDDSGIVAIPFVAIRDGARAAKNEYENKQTKITVCIR